MYINQIDDLIDKILNDFYSNLFKSKDFNKILQEINFVKYQKLINKILIDANKMIDKKEILKIIKVEENVPVIVEIIKKYLAIYLFLMIGIFFKGKKETFINNVVEFTKNQSSFDHRIDNFFNSESNGVLIKLSTISQNIITLLKVDSNKKKMLSQKDEYVDTIKFMNTVGNDFIKQYFKLENLSNNKKVQAHNIIKYLIIIDVYIEVDKNVISDILEESEKQNGEYIYIDIMLPHADFIDYNAIEGVLSKEDVENGLAHEIYELLLSHEEIEKVQNASVNDKVLELINKKVIIPVSEDFMLYHKDGEKYEKAVFTKGRRDKSDTKIKYIVSKIDSVSEYYSETVKKNTNLKEEIEKKLYAPLADRKATLMNNIEEVYIIKKLLDQGRSSIENNEYYNDLMNYRSYPYINFKDFKKYGFGIKLDKTVDVVRGTSFKASSDKNIQMRIGSNDQQLNIIGFIVPFNSKLIACQKSGEIVNVKKINYKSKGGNKKKIDNGYLATLKYLKHNLFREGGPKVSALWLYDLKTDKVVLDHYEQIKKLNNQEQIRMMIGKLHEDIQKLIYEKLIKLINDKKPISFYTFNKIIAYVNKNTIAINEYGKYYSELNKMITYEKYIKTDADYDTNEDKFPGLYGDIIPLPNAPAKRKVDIPIIEIDIGQGKKVTIKEVEQIVEKEEGAEQIGAICQHNVTWDNLLAIRKKQPNKFTEMLIEFTYQYVIENEETDAVCRSCGSQINIKKFVKDGTHNADGRYITLGQTMTVAVEDIPEYEKYIPSIRNIDKLVEKVAGIANIYTLLETSTNPKFKNPTKQRLIQTCIDLLVVHNKNLGDRYKERNKKITGLYGIDTDLSNLFVFPLDNSIFIYSSKDKDSYKFIKRNNIMTYLIFLMILDLTDSQIIYMGNDKLCNFYLFEKFGYKMFDGLKIIINNNNTIGKLSDYKVLCYLIFYISCLITKYNMWYAETTDGKMKRFDPIKQKMIVHSLVDFINSILEVEFLTNPDNLKNQSTKEKGSENLIRHYLYNILSIKFYQNLNSVYKNEDVLVKLDILQKNRSGLGTKKKSGTKEIKSIVLSSKKGFLDYTGIAKWNNCTIARHTIKLKEELLEKYTNISILTNCEDGSFHDWQIKGKTMECKNCGKLLNNLKSDKSSSDDILKNNYYIQLSKHAKKYCKSGKLHNFIYSNDTKCTLCVNCDFAMKDKIPTKALDQLQLNLTRMQDKIAEEEKEIKDKKQSIKSSIKTREDKIISELKSNFAKTKTHKEDYLNFVDKFIVTIENTIGKETNIHGQDIFLRHDVFIVDHDHNGYSLPKKFMIKESEKKIQYRKQHQHFNKDIIFYRNNKLQTDIFYDANSFLLLGYREKNKEYQEPKQVAFLRVNYSIMNRLKLLGYRNKLTNISEDKEIFLADKTNPTEAQEQKALKKIIGKVSRDRIQNLKKTITDIQRYLYRIKYNYDLDENTFLNQYVKVLNKKMSIKDEKKKKVFGKWKYVKYGLFYKSLDSKTVNMDLKSDYIEATEINQYDYHGNLILYYIVDQLSKLIEINTDKFVRQKVTFFIVDMINEMHGQYNEENIIKNFNIRRFTHIVNSRIETLDIEQKGHGLETETVGFYGEVKDPDAEVTSEEVDNIIDNREELEAIDMEDSLDYEIDYVQGINI